MPVSPRCFSRFGRVLTSISSGEGSDVSKLSHSQSTVDRYKYQYFILLKNSIVAIIASVEKFMIVCTDISPPLLLMNVKERNVGRNRNIIASFF